MNEEQIKDLKKLRESYRQAFGTDSGKQVLKDLQMRCFKNSSTYVPGDPNGININEGSRRILLHIESMMNLPIEELEKHKEETDV